MTWRQGIYNNNDDVGGRVHGGSGAVHLLSCFCSIVLSGVMHDMEKCPQLRQVVRFICGRTQIPHLYSYMYM